MEIELFNLRNRYGDLGKQKENTNEANIIPKVQSRKTSLNSPIKVLKKISKQTKDDVYEFRLKIVRIRTRDAEINKEMNSKNFVLESILEDPTAYRKCLHIPIILSHNQTNKQTT